MVSGVVALGSGWYRVSSYSIVHVDADVSSYVDVGRVAVLCFEGGGFEGREVAVWPGIDEATKRAEGVVAINNVCFIVLSKLIGYIKL